MDQIREANTVLMPEFGVKIIVYKVITYPKRIVSDAFEVVEERL